MRELINDLKQAPIQHAAAIGILILAAWFSCIVLDASCKDQTPLFVKESVK